MRINVVRQLVMVVCTRLGAGEHAGLGFSSGAHQGCHGPVHVPARRCQLCHPRRLGCTEAD